MNRYTFYYCYGGPFKGAQKYTQTIEAKDQNEAVRIFCDKYRYEEIYSITEFVPPFINIDKDETFIDAVHTDQTGGNIYNDVVKLKNGYIIRISADGLSVYENEAADEVGEDKTHLSF